MYVDGDFRLRLNEHAERDIHNNYVNLMSKATFKAVFADVNKRKL